MGSTDSFTELKVLQKVEIALSAIRPFLERDGSSISARDFKNGILYLIVSGACVGCALANDEFPEIIEALQSEIPEIKKVELFRPNGLPLY